MSDKERGAPMVPGREELPASAGLAADERVRLDDLAERFRTAAYPKMLGLDWEASPPEVERRTRMLQDWLKEVSARPGLNADDRKAISFCTAQLEQAHWVLKHPTLGPAYLKAARTRAEAQELGPTPKD